MSNLPAVSVRRFNTDFEQSFRSQSIVDVRPGEHGYVILAGGPALHGAVREAKAVPLGAFVTPVPKDKTPEQLRRRTELGQNLMRLALPEPGDPTYEHADSQ